MNYYILDTDGVPAPVDVLTWARWFENTSERIVACDEIAPGVKISTVFLGLDHNHSDTGPPVLWETLVFNDYGDGEQCRYTSKADAIAGHHAIVKRLSNATD